VWKQRGQPAPDSAALVKVQEDFNEGTISFVSLMTLIAAAG
jgi:hypothetical protein